MSGKLRHNSSTAGDANGSHPTQNATRMSSGSLFGLLGSAKMGPHCSGDHGCHAQKNETPTHHFTISRRRVARRTKPQPHPTRWASALLCRSFVLRVSSQQNPDETSRWRQPAAIDSRGCHQARWITIRTCSPAMISLDLTIQK